MAIFNLRHRLAALSAWALALALALGAALPQPAQAIGPENGRYAQMNRQPMLHHHTPDLSFQASSDHWATFDSRSRYSFDIRGCSRWGGCLHAEDTPPPGTCLLEKSTKYAYGTVGAGGGALAGGIIGATGGPYTALFSGGAGSYLGSAGAGRVGTQIGRMNATAIHNADGHHPGYASMGSGSVALGGSYPPNVKSYITTIEDGKTWSCPDTD